MTDPINVSDVPLPEFGDLSADRTDHPVLSAILADLRDRPEDILVAYYEDAP